MARQQIMNLEVDGIDDFIRMLENMEDEAIEGLEKAGEKACQPVLDSAKRYVPKDKGDLARSLVISKVKSKKEGRKYFKIHSKGVRAGGVKYAFAVETGTENMKPQPFLRPAVDNNKEKINDIYVDEIGEAIIRRAERS